MIIEKINLSNFRNYKNATAVFSEGVNIISGENAQGKTNLLESVYLLSIGRSMRTPRDKELIMWGESEAKLKAEAKKREGGYTVGMRISGRDKKTVEINGMPVSRLGELMGVINTVMFSPAEIDIIKDSPKIRRRFLDIAICQNSEAYFYSLSRYNKILSQRNKLLKDGISGGALDVWDLQLAEYGAKIILSRKEFITKIEPHIKANHMFLTEKENLSVAFLSTDGETEQDIKHNLEAEILSAREKDTYLRFTSVGPQTDDFKVEADGVDLRKYGSQGQQRTAALSLKLAELDYYKTEESEYPVLLLDDVFSELDSFRQAKLAERVKDFQTIITCTHLGADIDSHFNSATRLYIKNGEIV